MVWLTKSKCLFITVALAVILIVSTGSANEQTPRLSPEVAQMILDFIKTGFADKTNEQVAEFIAQWGIHDPDFNQLTLLTFMANFAAEKTKTGKDKEQIARDVEQVLQMIQLKIVLSILPGNKKKPAMRAAVTDLHERPAPVLKAGVTDLHERSDPVLKAGVTEQQEPVINDNTDKNDLFTQIIEDALDANDKPDGETLADSNEEAEWMYQTEQEAAESASEKAYDDAYLRVYGQMIEMAKKRNGGTLTDADIDWAHGIADNAGKDAQAMLDPNVEDSFADTGSTEVFDKDKAAAEAYDEAYDEAYKNAIQAAKDRNGGTVTDADIEIAEEVAYQAGQAASENVYLDENLFPVGQQNEDDAGHRWNQPPQGTVTTLDNLIDQVMADAANVGRTGTSLFSAPPGAAFGFGPGNFFNPNPFALSQFNGPVFTKYYTPCP